MAEKRLSRAEKRGLLGHLVVISHSKNVGKLLVNVAGNLGERKSVGPDLVDWRKEWSEEN